MGTDMVVKSAADGCTLVSGSASVLAVNGFLFQHIPYDVATAFSPITQYNTVTNVLVVTPGLPVKSVKELIAYAKANPGKLSFASAGDGRLRLNRSGKRASDGTFGGAKIPKQFLQGHCLPGRQ